MDNNKIMCRYGIIRLFYYAWLNKIDFSLYTKDPTVMTLLTELQNEYKIITKHDIKILLAEIILN